MNKVSKKRSKIQNGNFKIYKIERKLRRKKERIDKKRRNKIFNLKKFGQVPKDFIEDNENSELSEHEDMSSTFGPKDILKEHSQSKYDQSDDESFEQTNMTSKEVRKLQHEEAIEDENRNIKKLEKLLNMKKKQGKTKLPQGFKEGGLDYILELIDGPKEDLYSDKDACKELYEMFTQSEKDSNENTMIHNENKYINKIASKRKHQLEQKQMKKLKFIDTNNDINSESEFDDKSENLDEKDENLSSDQASRSFMSNENSFDEISNEETQNDPNDIYGQKNAQSINVQSVFDSKNKSEIETIDKSLRHCLKFIKDSELQTLFSLIEELYKDNSRNAMNEALYNHIKEHVFSSCESDEVCIKFAQIIALLHVNIGSEVGAYILQNLASQLDASYKEKSKSVCMNICILISYLFIFDVCHSLLLFDVINLFSKEFSEIDLNLSLIILKNAGFHLRKSDPIAMQALITSFTEKLLVAYPVLVEGSPEYMLNEILHAIKKKSLYKKLTKDPSEIDHLKKQVKLLLPKGTKIQSLRISFQDILNAKNKIGWWIVGAGWEDGDYSSTQVSSDQLPNSSLPKFDKKLMDLAASYNLNTELRKILFCILMTANDANSAFAKILGLQLKPPHERDVVVVIILTCLHYRKFHPMFGLLLQKLCKAERKKYFMAIKCCLWDQMKEIDNFSELQLSIFAKLVTQLFANNVVALSLLKAEDFTTPTKNNLKFIRLLLLEILLEESEYNCKHIFGKISKLDKFKVLREVIKLYLNYIENKVKPTLISDNQAKLEKRLAMAKDILNAQLL